MVSLKIQLLATILFLSEAYSQFPGCGCGSPQRSGPTAAPSTGSIIPCGQFIVPAIIKPLIPGCQPASPAQRAPCTPNKQAPVVPGSSLGCADDDDDSELDRLLYLLISNIIENRKGSSKKQNSPSIACESSASSGAGSSDVYESYACGYSDDYDYGALPCAYSSSAVYGSGSDPLYTVPSCDNTCPEICVYVRPFCE